MIYLQNKPNKQQSVKIPTTNAIVGSFTLSVFSTVDRREIFQVLRYGTGKRLYVTVSLRLPEGISNGEYEYRIVVGGKMTDSGLAVIGQYETEKQYKESFEYKQYGE